eukprot:6207056-Pleurochrysis_carterae.AAC.1
MCYLYIVGEDKEPVCKAPSKKCLAEAAAAAAAEKENAGLQIGTTPATGKRAPRTSKAKNTKVKKVAANPVMAPPALKPRKDAPAHATADSEPQNDNCAVELDLPPRRIRYHRRMRMLLYPRFLRLHLQGLHLLLHLLSLHQLLLLSFQSYNSPPSMTASFAPVAASTAFIPPPMQPQQQLHPVDRSLHQPRLNLSLPFRSEQV